MLIQYFVAFFAERRKNIVTYLLFYLLKIEKKERQTINCLSYEFGVLAIR